MDVDQERLIQLFLDLVEIDGVSLKERLVADAIKKRLSQIDVSFYEDEAASKINGNCGNLVIQNFNRSKTDDSLLLLAHLDTVQSTANLKAVVENDIIRSDGSTILGGDDRTGVAIILYVIEEIARRKLRHRNFEVVFSVAEELGMHGTLALDFGKLHSWSGYIFDCSRETGCYVATTPTAIDFQIEFQGKSAHSGVAPEKGINALSMAVELTRKIPVGRVDEQTVANVGKITGGTAINVVPDHVVIAGEIRSFNRDKIDEICENIRQDAASISEKYGGNINVDFTTGFEGFHLSKDQRVVNDLEKNMGELGIRPDPLKYYGGSDANVLNANGISAVNIGIGVNNPHSNNEFVVIDDFVKATKLLLRLLEVEEV
ncbi:M20/M25/M40 family metallo-hydrolase [candidate division KSB1 bacterium]|nr:M20/M25/M40 family metallo-hydrolase [candidate division KSB1 bacterium]